jgi:hypothetical protein
MMDNEVKYGRQNIGQVSPDDAAVARLKRELAKTKAKRDIEKYHRFSAKDPT